MPPSLREVAWRVPRKRHDGGSHELSVHRTVILSERSESKDLAPGAGQVPRLRLPLLRIMTHRSSCFAHQRCKLPISCVM